MRFSKNFKGFLAFVIILMLASIGYSAVKSPDERKEKIELSKKLLDRIVIPLTEEAIVLVGDPFSVTRKVVEEAIVEVDESLSAQELMPILAKNVKPTGIFAVGGAYYLIFKEIRVKSGESVPVMYQNIEYNLKIVNVLRNGYSLRLGDAEVAIKLK